MSLTHFISILACAVNTLQIVLVVYELLSLPLSRLVLNCVKSSRQRTLQHVRTGLLG